MVKFGKYLEINQNPEWKDYYINYLLLKAKIKDLKKMQDKEYVDPYASKKTDEEVEAELKQLTKSIDKKLLDHIKILFKNKNKETVLRIKRQFISVGKYVDEFLTSLDQEVQKFKKFYLELEKEIEHDLVFLKKELNTLTYLHHIKEVIEFSDHLENSVNKVLAVCQFINLNITAVRKILKKFDKKFNNSDNPIALHYIKDNLSKKDSSLVYILQFKVIDEASALMDRMTKSLEKSIFKKFSQNKKYKNELLNEPLLLKEINLEELSGTEIYKNINKIIQKKINKIKDKIERIDDANNLIRSGIEVWSLIVKSNMRVVDDYFKSKTSLHNANVEQTKEMLLKNLTPQLKKDEEMYHINTQTRLNLFIALSHTFLYTMNCYIVQLTNGLYVAELGATKTYSGLIMGMTHFAAIFCTFMYSSWTNTSYKLPLLLSCTLFILGNFTYSFADFNQSLVLMALGRFLIGMASARVVNRRYIIEKIPQHLIMHYSFLYVGLTCLGMASGPIIALLLMYLLPGEHIMLSLKFNQMTNPGWFSMIIWIIFFFVVLTGFKDPENANGNSKENSSHSSQSIAREESEVQELTQPTTNNNHKDIIANNDIENDINSIIEEEENSYSYMSISFTILILILLTIRMTTESLCVLTPITMPIDFEVSNLTVALFLSITAGIVFPITYMINMFINEHIQRKIIFILLIICFVSCVFIVSNPLLTVSLGRFVVFYTLLFVSCNILESVDSALLAMIFPSNFNLGFCNSGFTIILTTTGGKAIGSFLITIIGLFLELEIVYDCLITFYLISYLTLCLLVYFNYSDLRVKAIARILQKKEIEAK